MSSHENRYGARDLSLTHLGWDSHWADQFDVFAPAGSRPARVTVQHKGSYVVITEHGEIQAEVLGRLRYEAAVAEQLPAVGDWVALHVHDGGPGIIHAVLPRKSSFTRKGAGRETTEQVLAANIDVVFVVAALDVPVNARRVERYLTMAWGSGATPVVVMTKADLSEDVAGPLSAIEAIGPGTPIHVVSAVSKSGIGELHGYIKEDLTATLLGASGSGKSTLVNVLYGGDILKTAPIRYDGKGRHTTTHRELVVIPGGGLIIDTPGMRELQLWDPGTGLDDAFEDIAELARACRFTDCRHENEPGCAVLGALASGALAPERLASFKKLGRELRHLEIKRDARAQADERKKWKSIQKSLRANPKVRAARRDR